MKTPALWKRHYAAARRLGLAVRLARRYARQRAALLRPGGADSRHT